MIELYHLQLLSAILFALGVYGVLARKSAILILMSIELMLNAANMTLITFSRAWSEASGQGIAFFVMALAAAEAAVGLAIVVAVFRTRRTMNVDEINLMKK